ncbi:MAG: hypothetical protein ACRDQB_02205, partial [Thermocrispum sp.]
MTSRIGRRARMVAVAAAMTLAASACDSAVSGSPEAGQNQHEFAAEQAFEEAVGALAARPLMRYTTTVAGAKGEKVTVAVSRTGSALGTSDLDGKKLTMAVLGDKLYVRTGKEVWQDLGAKPDEAKKFGDRFVLTDPEDVGFDPADLLAPKKVAEVLAEKVAQAGE